MGIPEENLIIPRQTHGCLCRVIDRTPFPEMELDGVDGLVTSLPDVVIGVNTADCLPVVMADEDNGVVGVAHPAGLERWAELFSRLWRQCSARGRMSGALK